MSKSNADRRNQESGTTQQNLSGIPMNQPGGHCATGKSAGRGRAKWGRAHDMAILIWKTQYRSRHFLGSLFFERCAIQYRALERGQCSLNDTAKKSERHSHLMYAIDVLVNLQVKCMFLCFCSQFARPGNGLCSSLARRKWT